MTPTAPPKPFAGLGARAFLTLVREMEKTLAKCFPDALASVRRAVAVKTIIMGFTNYQQIAGTHEEDVKEFFPSPVLRSAFLQFVQYADRDRQVKRRRQEQVLDVFVSPGASVSSGDPLASEARLAHRPASAESLAAQVKDLDAEKLQTSIAKVLQNWDVPVVSGTPAAVVASVSRAHDQDPRWSSSGSAVLPQMR